MFPCGFPVGFVNRIIALAQNIFKFALDLPHRRMTRSEAFSVKLPASCVEIPITSLDRSSLPISVNSLVEVWNEVLEPSSSVYIIGLDAHRRKKAISRLNFERTQWVGACPAGDRCV